MINGSPFGGSLACGALGLGWCCLSSPMAVRRDLGWGSRPLRIAGILFGIVGDFGRTGVMGGCSGGLVSCGVGGVGGPRGFTLLALAVRLGGLVLLAGGWRGVGGG